MSQEINIKNKILADLTAPTPQNTPLTKFGLDKSVLEAEKQANGSSNTAKKVEEEIQGLLKENPQMVQMVESKLSSLIGQSSGYIESLPKDVKLRVKALKGIQEESKTIQVEFRKRMLDLEKVFFKKYQPLYARRAEIVNGLSEPKDEELDPEVPLGEPDDEVVRGIPEFWLTCIRNTFLVSEMVSERDAQALRYLEDIRVTDLENDQPGYCLEFQFAENPFFKNSVLKKKYYYQEDLNVSPDQELLYHHAEGDKIDWSNVSNNLTVTVRTKKQHNRRTQETRTVRTTVPAESFFNFFTPPTLNEDDDEDDSLMEEKAELVELDYQLGEVFKDHVVPFAVNCFFGEPSGIEDDEEEDDNDSLLEAEDSEEDELAGSPLSE
ncbi:nucleosome assembly protein Nap2 [Schizosaccharomyces japonicus yFS275]|uniref:Nucleosome assembly protein Nap2 n=1 Tax=Schizosaccharomyces japonicus (strain yFS275 / FY16936) TaxID=402676 RepID=B6JX16_SCHJY|nr:nucleosome assembly protein Nap2 [Schizosaccharomyces japonicus yFS275]EEB05917.1 nucleosome assembly protein Nap2 [Schizosaccharomyces japonicus yFS275]